MTEVWAHRGASGYAPENTIPAFELAIEQGADGIELDVQLTRDDHVIVIHDETLERTTDGHGWVADHALEDLKRLDASNGFEKYAGCQLPTLDEVFELVADTDLKVNVELKNSQMAYKGLEERVLALVDAHDMGERVILSTFNHYSLRHLAGLGTKLPLGALYSEPLWKPWSYAVRLGATALHPSLSATRRKVIDKAHEHGLAVNVWTVNEPSDMKKLISLGADAVITNYPNVARALAD